jgi:hypothetical protein
MIPSSMEFDGFYPSVIPFSCGVSIQPLVVMAGRRRVVTGAKAIICVEINTSKILYDETN